MRKFSMFEFESDLRVGDGKFEVLEGAVRVSPVVLMQADFFREHQDYGFDFFGAYNLRTKDVNVVATYYPEAGDGHGEVVNLPLTPYEKSELIDSMEAFCKATYKVGCLELLNMQRVSVGIRRMDNLSGLDIETCARYLIRTFARDGQWLDGDDLEEMERCEPYLGEAAIGQYLHGCCDEWVLEHFQPGDVAIVWNEFSEEIGKVCLIHCYIQRGDVFVDVRGETEDEELVEEGFEHGYDHGKVYCSTLEEYKSCIREICGYEDKKWAKGLDNMKDLNEMIHSAQEVVQATKKEATEKATVTLWARLGVSIDVTPDELASLNNGGRGARELLVSLIQSDRCRLDGETYFPYEANHEHISDELEFDLNPVQLQKRNRNDTEWDLS